MKTTLIALVLVCSSYVSAQKFTVKIIDRKDNDTEYTYVVPSYSYSNSNANVNCNGNDTNVNCNGTSLTNTTSTPAQVGSFHVHGATLTLILPDGRAAVVNCESKFKERFAGAAGNRRSCRIPLVDEIEAEFKGDHAKLFWNVSIDGKKTQSETYNILAVLDKPKDNQK